MTEPDVQVVTNPEEDLLKKYGFTPVTGTPDIPATKNTGFVYTPPEIAQPEITEPVVEPKVVPGPVESKGSFFGSIANNLQGQLGNIEKGVGQVMVDVTGKQKINQLATDIQHKKIDVNNDFGKSAQDYQTQVDVLNEYGKKLQNELNDVTRPYDMAKLAPGFDMLDTDVKKTFDDQKQNALQQWGKMGEYQDYQKKIKEATGKLDQYKALQTESEAKIITPGGSILPIPGIQLKAKTNQETVHAIADAATTKTFGESVLDDGIHNITSAAAMAKGKDGFWWDAGQVLGGAIPFFASVAASVALPPAAPLISAATGIAYGLEGAGSMGTAYEDYMKQTRQPVDAKTRDLYMLAGGLTMAIPSMIGLGKLVPEQLMTKTVSETLLKGGFENGARKVLVEFAEQNPEIAQRIIKDVASNAITGGNIMGSITGLDIALENSFKKDKDKTGFLEAIKKVGESYGMGALTMAFTGPLKTLAVTRQQMDSRKSNGGVTIGINGNTNEPFEIIGKDNDGNYVGYTGDSQKMRVAPEVVTTKVTVPLDLFNQIAKEAPKNKEAALNLETDFYKQRADKNIDQIMGIVTRPDGSVIKATVGEGDSKQDVMVIGGDPSVDQVVTVVDGAGKKWQVSSKTLTGSEVKPAGQFADELRQTQYQRIGYEQINKGIQTGALQPPTQGDQQFDTGSKGIWTDQNGDKQDITVDQTNPVTGELKVRYQQDGQDLVAFVKPDELIPPEQAQAEQKAAEIQQKKTDKVVAPGVIPEEVGKGTPVESTGTIYNLPAKGQKTVSLPSVPISNEEVQINKVFNSEPKTTLNALKSKYPQRTWRIENQIDKTDPDAEAKFVIIGKSTIKPTVEAPITENLKEPNVDQISVSAPMVAGNTEEKISDKLIIDPKKPLESAPIQAAPEVIPPVIEQTKPEATVVKTETVAPVVTSPELEISKKEQLIKDLIAKGVAQDSGSIKVIQAQIQKLKNNVPEKVQPIGKSEQLEPFKLDASNPVSKSGRNLSPIPTDKATSSRTANKQTKEWNRWLINNAKAEVAGDDHKTQLVDQISLNAKGDIPQADKNLLNDILFGEPDGVDIVYPELPKNDKTKTVKTNSVQKPKSAGEAIFGKPDVNSKPEETPPPPPGANDNRRWQSEYGNDPHDIASAYNEELLNIPETNLPEWQKDLLKSKVSARSFARFGDNNQIGRNIAINWIDAKNDRENDIDGIAQELSDIHGTEVTPQMIVDFILDHPNKSIRKTTDLQNALAKRYKQVTGSDIKQHKFVSENLDNEENQAFPSIDQKHAEIINENGINTITDLKALKEDLFTGFPYEDKDYERIKAYLEARDSNAPKDESHGKDLGISEEVPGVGEKSGSQGKREVPGEINPVVPTEDTQPSERDLAIQKIDSEIADKKNQLANIRTAREKKSAELSNRNGLFGDTKPVGAVLFDTEFNASRENVKKALADYDGQIRVLEEDIKRLESGKERAADEAAGQMKMEQPVKPEEATPVKPKFAGDVLNIPDKPGEKITDFGEKIEGAKKDTYKRLQKVTENDLISQPLSKSFPRPDFVKMVNDGTLTEDGAMILKFFYDVIPPKPRSTHKVKRWVGTVQHGIDVFKELLENKENGKRLIDKIKEVKSSDLANQLSWFEEVQKALGFPKEDINLGSFEIKKFHMKDGERVSIVKGHTIISDHKTVQEAADRLQSIIANNKDKSQGVKLSVYQDRNTKKFFIGKKTATGVNRLVENIESSKEAFQFLKDQDAQLQELWNSKKVAINERRDTNRDRVGADYRKGKDVTPEVFSDTFGFRGTQFGNWVDNAERQTSLNDAYDALMDLSNAIGIPSKAISLGGELGIAFGARGSGKFSAHYEPDKIVINLTKTRGAGSLAHEWWHALDNYFSRKRGEKLNMLTEKPRQKVVMKDGVVVPDERIRTEMVDAFKGVMDAINKSGLPGRGKILDSSRSDVYWTKPTELSARSFENYVIEKLGRTGEQNDYLANFKAWTEWMGESGLNMESYPYPFKEETPAINEAFDTFFNTIETKEEGDNVKMFRFSGPVGHGKVPELTDREVKAEEVEKKTDPKIGYWKDLSIPENHDTALKIYKETGMQRGIDGRWRSDRNDKSFKLNTDAWDYVLKDPIPSEEYVTYKLVDLIDNNWDGFNEYNELRQAEVYIHNGADEGEQCSYYDGKIYVNQTFAKGENAEGLSQKSNLYPVLRIGLLHELQHFIQDIEGFESGANYNSIPELALSRFKDLSTQEIIDNLDRFSPNWRKYHPDLDKGISENNPEVIEKGRKIIAYFHSSGEVEAYNTEVRDRMTDEERGKTLISDTEIVPRNQQWSSKENESKAYKFAGDKIGFNDKISHVPGVTESTEFYDKFRESLLNTLIPYTRGGGGKMASQVMRENLGHQARTMDLMAARLKEAKIEFDKMTKDESLTFIDNMERGIPQDNIDLQNYSDALREGLDTSREKVRELGTGKLDSYIENYFPHAWEDPKKAGQVLFSGKRPLEGSKAFLKQRTVPTTKEGVDKGLIPITWNPVEAALSKIREMEQYVMAHRTINELKEAGYVKYVRVGKDRPEGFVKIDDKVSTVQIKTDDGLQIVGHYYAQENAATILNNFLSKGLRGNQLYDIYRGLGNTITQVQLGLSAFHLGFTSMDASISKFALGLEYMYQGKIGSALKHFAITPAAPVTNFIQGDKLMKAWYGNPATPELQLIAEYMELAGGRAQMDDFYAQKFGDKLHDHIKNRRYIRAAWQFPLKLIELTSKPILGYIVPRQKLGVFMDMARYEMEVHPDATIEERRAALQYAWNSVDNRMGQLVYDNLFWNKVFKDVAMASVRSVGWNLGTIREVGGAPKELFGVLKDTMSGKRSENTHKIAYVISLFGITMLYNALLQFIRTGKGPDEFKDYFFPKTGRITSSGDWERSSLPTYVKDLYHYGTNFIGTIKNKLSPVNSIVVQMKNNKDFYGVKIFNEDDPFYQKGLEVIKYLGTQLIPFGIRNAQKSVGKSTLDKILPFVGITPAPYDLNMSRAEKRAYEMMARKLPVGGRTTEQKERSDHKRELAIELRATGGNFGRINQELRTHVISKEEHDDLKENYMLTGLQSTVKHFSYDEAWHIYKMAMPDERKQLYNIVKTKMENKRKDKSLSTAERDDVNAMYNELKNSR